MAKSVSNSILNNCQISD